MASTSRDRAHNLYLGVALVTLAITPTWLFTAWQVEDDRANHDFWTWGRWPAFIPVGVALVLLAALLSGWSLPGLRRELAEPRRRTGSASTASVRPEPPSVDMKATATDPITPPRPDRRAMTDEQKVQIDQLRADWGLRNIGPLEVGLHFLDAPSGTFFAVLHGDVTYHATFPNLPGSSMMGIYDPGLLGVELHKSHAGVLHMLGWFNEVDAQRVDDGTAARVSMLLEPWGEFSTLRRLPLDRAAALTSRRFQHGTILTVELKGRE